MVEQHLSTIPKTPHSHSNHAKETKPRSITVPYIHFYNLQNTFSLIFIAKFETTSCINIRITWLSGYVHSLLWEQCKWRLTNSHQLNLQRSYQCHLHLFYRTLNQSLLMLPLNGIACFCNISFRLLSHTSLITKCFNMFRMGTSARKKNNMHFWFYLERTLLWYVFWWIYQICKRQGRNTHPLELASSWPSAPYL